MIAAVVDTHAAIWHIHANRRLSGRALNFIQKAAANAQLDAAKVPDMPDRIIAATALHLSLSVPVISKDARIQLSGLTTIW